jgi:hypothetical protein
VIAFEKYGFLSQKMFLGKNFIFKLLPKMCFDNFYAFWTLKNAFNYFTKRVFFLFKRTF